MCFSKFSTFESFLLSSYNRRLAIETNNRYWNRRIPSVNTGTCHLLVSWHNNNAGTSNTILCLFWKCERRNVSRIRRNRRWRRSKERRRNAANVEVEAPCGLALVNDPHSQKMNRRNTYTNSSRIVHESLDVEGELLALSLDFYQCRLRTNGADWLNFTWVLNKCGKEHCHMWRSTSSE